MTTAVHASPSTPPTATEALSRELLGRPDRDVLAVIGQDRAAAGP
jgi:hypothetical protein